MTKRGYTHIIVPRHLHETLRQLAQIYNLSIAKLIEKLLSINTNQQNSPNQQLNNQNLSLKHENNQKLSLFSQNKENLGVVGGEAPYMVLRAGFEPATTGSKGRYT